MIDINTPVLTAYYTALQALPIPVYNSIVPDEVSPNDYVIFNIIGNENESTFNSHDTEITVQVAIYTTADGTNPNTADAIAGQVFDIILNGERISPLMITSWLALDTSSLIGISDRLHSDERILRFTHKVMHNMI